MSISSLLVPNGYDLNALNLNVSQNITCDKFFTNDLVIEEEDFNNLTIFNTLDVKHIENASTISTNNLEATNQAEIGGLVVSNSADLPSTTITGTIGVSGTSFLHDVEAGTITASNYNGNACDIINGQIQTLNVSGQSFFSDDVNVSTDINLKGRLFFDGQAGNPFISTRNGRVLYFTNASGGSSSVRFGANSFRTGLEVRWDATTKKNGVISMWNNSNQRFFYSSPTLVEINTQTDINAVLNTNNDVNIGGDLEVSGDMVVEGNTAIQGGLDVGENITTDGSVIAQGNLEAVGDAVVDKLRFQNTSNTYLDADEISYQITNTGNTTTTSVFFMEEAVGNSQAIFQPVRVRPFQTITTSPFVFNLEKMSQRQALLMGSGSGDITINLNFNTNTGKLNRDYLPIDHRLIICRQGGAITTNIRLSVFDDSGSPPSGLWAIAKVRTFFQSTNNQNNYTQYLSGNNNNIFSGNFTGTIFFHIYSCGDGATGEGAYIIDVQIYLP